MEWMIFVHSNVLCATIDRDLALLVDNTERADFIRMWWARLEFVPVSELTRLSPYTCHFMSQAMRFLELIWANEALAASAPIGLAHRDRMI